MSKLNAGGQSTDPPSCLSTHVLNEFPVEAARWNDTEVVAQISAGTRPGPGRIAVYRDGETSIPGRIQVLTAGDGRCR